MPSTSFVLRIALEGMQGIAPYTGKEIVTIQTETRQSTTPCRANDLATLLRNRRSVRSYQDRPVTRAQLEQIIEAARWAPSPHGRQPWRFVVLTRQEPKIRLAEYMGTTWRKNLEMDGQAADIVNIRLEKSRQRILNAPALIIPCLYLEDLDHYPDAQRQADETTMAIQSLGAAVQNMLLMAYDLGLDAGWMCAPLFCPEVVCEALHLDKRIIPHALITVGYAAADPKRRERLPLQSLIVQFD
jgi:coenzyme F420-0:L-glutamate ligase/coenzyme F420-1:gamma-L-glutamate ligase